MNIKTLPSPNRDNREIPVEYLVLHYTAVDLQQTLALFMMPGGTVSAHLVIDLDGTVYELVDCLAGRALRARHAGPSHWQQDGRQLAQFNDFALGIELVNPNGNVFPFTEAQYQSLAQLMPRLQAHYPALKNPERVLGHEHIAGFRGKADPGLCFDWPRFFKNGYPDQIAPARPAICPEPLQTALRQLQAQQPDDEQACSRYWQAISLMTETSIRLIYQAGAKNQSEKKI